jgi:hypothetical protein
MATFLVFERTNSSSSNDRKNVKDILKSNSGKTPMLKKEVATKNNALGDFVFSINHENLKFLLKDNSEKGLYSFQEKL